MDNFVFHNPVRLVFGRGTIGRLPDLLPRQGVIMMTWGGGSIKSNGVFDQVVRALKGRRVIQFPGIEPNPRYSTLMKAVKLARKRRVKFLLAVGGGSVLDGTKFIAAACEYRGREPWDILEKSATVKKATPLGAVLTLPATGSEMNGNAVISRAETRQKLGFGSRLVYPRFAVLDPQTTFSLPPRQTTNGVVDTMVHVFEQYLTFDSNAPLNEGMSEAVLRTTIENGGRVLENPGDYDIRANLMWAATMALNGLIGAGVPQDWTSHAIGHEITAYHGLDHGQTLAVISPSVLRYKKDKKMAMLARYARRVLGVREDDDGRAADLGVDMTEEFWNRIGVKTKLSGYGVGDENFAVIADRLCGSGNKLGERGDIGREDVMNILRMSL